MWTPQIEFFIKALMDIKSNLKDTEPKYSGKSGKIFCLWCTVILLSHLKRANLKLNRQKEVMLQTLILQWKLYWLSYLSVWQWVFQHFYTGVFSQIFVLIHKTQRVHGASWALIAFPLLLWSINAKWQKTIFLSSCLINFGNVTKNKM